MPDFDTNVPYNRENLLAWAKSQATGNNTTEESWLVACCIAFDCAYYEDESKSDLIRAITDLLQDGTQGYLNYTIDLLLDQCDNNVETVLSCSGTHATLHEFLQFVTNYTGVLDA